ncbi:glycoside hydrolase family 1 protein [Patescibacteria group bacterium]|nr:glycoside hydrolase family 1 protein [Patescibacteria group bacterium]MBU0879242.1 glycoside hydrolase family 1 protein [Patescibacteria group bacterium]MBU0879913.1 glycoside hydrolase family 1 protein [Patescibacteria group bacterium]MBU0898110.1 glycoside hydrolase family 1 protein [Patescibacteria group bacterium]MBU1062564.1 glycoside hydrolase family 1 protein [Patescibacteria group bacterium]
MNKKILKFPKNFLWGVSTSAYQIEGGITNDWSKWENSELRIKKLKSENKNPKDFICGQACDSYNKYEEDLNLTQNLNCKAFRMGIEWTRIEPTKGQFNLNEIEHYKKVLQEAKKRNLQIVLTLWHWTNPIWLAQEGGWANKKTINYFINYVELIVKELGKYVDFWITLNEPMVHINHGYISGKFPPNKKNNLLSAYFAYKNLIKAHKLAYKKIHQLLPNSKVSFTSLTNYFEPNNPINPLDCLIVNIAKYFQHQKFFNQTAQHLDFIALDYYFHNRLSWHSPFQKNLNKKTTDLGWEIYPKGIYYILKYSNKFKKPIYIMENGIADANDKQRAKFIINHLKYVHKAINQGIDVRGYFYWSLFDNFEWADGWAPKFGLYTIDKKTFKRAARPSAKIYAEICKNNLIEVN